MVRIVAGEQILDNKLNCYKCKKYYSLYVYHFTLYCNHEISGS